MRRNWKWIFGCFAIGLLLLFTALPKEKIYAVTSDSIKEKQNQIKEASGEKEKLQNQLSNLKKIKEELEEQKGNLRNYVATLDNNLKEMEGNIASLEEEIIKKEVDIEETEQELELAQEKEEKQYEALKSRIRIMYENGGYQTLEILSNANSWSDLMIRADYAERVYDADRKMMEEYQMNCQYIQLCKEQLILEKEILDEQKKVVEEERKNLEALIQEKNREITAYESDIQNKSQAIREYEAEITAQDDFIKAMEAIVAEEKRKLLESNSAVISYDGGVFKFPMATYTRVSDDYGMRIHPTLGVEQFHNGVDFAAPAGTAIYAAYDGKVVAADYSSTMGNYVMIDHGDGLYTIYMHASKLHVSKGSAVAKGETIAAVGSTGRSTGNHLHFSVRLNGSYVSPWNYLSQ